MSKKYLSNIIKYFMFILYTSNKEKIKQTKNNIIDNNNVKPKMSPA